MEYLCICNHTNSNGESAMEFLAICSHTDYARESAMGFLAICSNTDCNVEAAMGFLFICSNTDCSGRAAMGFLAICSHTDCQGVRQGVPGHLQLHRLQREGCVEVARLIYKCSVNVPTESFQRPSSRKRVS